MKSGVLRNLQRVICTRGPTRSDKTEHVMHSRNHVYCVSKRSFIWLGERTIWWSRVRRKLICCNLHARSRKKKKRQVGEQLEEGRDTVSPAAERSSSTAQATTVGRGGAAVANTGLTLQFRWLIVYRDCMGALFNRRPPVPYNSFCDITRAVQERGWQVASLLVCFSYLDFLLCGSSR